LIFGNSLIIASALEATWILLLDEESLEEERSKLEANAGEGFGSRNLGRSGKVECILTLSSLGGGFGLLGIINRFHILVEALLASL
jgi:hypothetical protein